MSYDKYLGSHQILVGVDPAVVASGDNVLRLQASGNVNIFTTGGDAFYSGINTFINALNEISLNCFGNITLNTPSGVYISSDLGDVELAAGQDIYIGSPLGSNDIYFNEIPKLDTSSTSVLGLETLRVFQMTSFFTDEPDDDIVAPPPGIEFACAGGGSQDGINLYKDFQNEWRSSADTVYGWYISQLKVVLLESEDTPSGTKGSTIDPSDYTCQIYLYKWDYTDSSPTLLKSWGFANDELSASPTVEDLDLSSLSNTERTIKQGEILTVRVRLMSIDPAGGGGTNYANDSGRINAVLMGGKEILLHP